MFAQGKHYAGVRVLTLSAYAGALLFLLLFVIMIRLVPYPDLEAFLQRPYSTVWFDRQGRLMYIAPLEEGLRREYISIDEIPGEAVQIFLASEDRRFALHPGIDPLAIMRSLALNLSAGRTVSGASTITMQLARIVSPHDGGISGKLREMLNAFRLEAKLSKREILELWLNSLPFSYRAEGVQTASRLFFSTDIRDITRPQAALLALVPRRPSDYNPVENGDTVKNAASALLRRTGKPPAEGEMELAVRSAAWFTWPFEAPHFIMHFRELAEGRVRASLDLDLNHFLQDRINQELQTYRESRLTNGAALVIDNRSGEILAYAGSRDFWDEQNDGQIDGVQITNQPGSTIKPFLYAYALENGFLPSSILPDIPLDFGGEEIYVPSNFNRRFTGPVRLRVALSSSLNVPAVYLLERLGVRNFSSFLLSLDFESLRRQMEHVGAGLALGNAEVSLYELVRAFSVFARNGRPLELSWQAGGQLPEIEPVISQYTAAIVCDILSDDVSRYPGFGNARTFQTSFPAMFKTGTANQFQNIWALGATPEYTVGVWLGNFSGETVIGRTGSSIPLRIAVDALNWLKQGAVPRGYSASGSETFPRPSGKEVEICTISGMLAGPYCESRMREVLPHEVNVSSCTWHRLEGGRITVRYPSEYSAWMRSERRGSLRVEAHQVPEILQPRNGAVFYLDPGVSPSAQAAVVEFTGSSDTSYEVLINDETVGVVNGTRWLFPLRKGRWRIRIGVPGTTVYSEEIQLVVK